MRTCKFLQNTVECQRKFQLTDLSSNEGLVQYKSKKGSWEFFFIIPQLPQYVTKYSP